MNLTCGYARMLKIIRKSQLSEQYFSVLYVMPMGMMHLLIPINLIKKNF